jgi:hypothetical protein
MEDSKMPHHTDHRRYLAQEIAKRAESARCRANESAAETHPRWRAELRGRARAELTAGFAAFGRLALLLENETDARHRHLLERAKSKATADLASALSVVKSVS